MKKGDAFVLRYYGTPDRFTLSVPAATNGNAALCIL
jgi:hypothetical protein